MSELFFVARLVDDPRRLDCSRSAWICRVIEGLVPREVLRGAECPAINFWRPLAQVGDFLGVVCACDAAGWQSEGLDWHGYVRDFSAALQLQPYEFVAGPWQTETEALQGLEDLTAAVGVAYREEE